MSSRDVSLQSSPRPVLSVIAYKDEEDEIKIANDTDFGLHAYASSADTESARRVAFQLLSWARSDQRYA
jgi:hypothetical protein